MVCVLLYLLEGAVGDLSQGQWMDEGGKGYCHHVCGGWMEEGWWEDERGVMRDHVGGR